MRNQHLSLCCLYLLSGLLSGCTSFSKGVTEAILDRQTEDTRKCLIAGHEFEGLDSLFETEDSRDADSASPARLKVLKVHGIGEHQPGYSGRLLNGLVTEYGFEKFDETVKMIQLGHRRYPDELGILRIHRFVNLDASREMLYYELTWDPILAQEKQLVEFDNTAEASALRTDFSHELKVFMNATLPDAIMYNTRYREPIQLSVAQAICWMLSENWDDLPNNQRATCMASDDNYWSEFDTSSIAIISHSMGSRISIDALQTAVSRISQRPDSSDIYRIAQNKPIHLYMLSNQLPLLQLGQPLPEVHDQVQSYCLPGGDHYERRFFERLQIVAFSDPNDLFSYSVSPEYINRYVDSRLCPQVTNVMVQIARVTSILGLKQVANPSTAHTEYEVDSRVLKMLVSGFGKSHGQDEVKERCKFIEAIPDY